MPWRSFTSSMKAVMRAAAMSSGPGFQRGLSPLLDGFMGSVDLHARPGGELRVLRGFAAEESGGLLGGGDADVVTLFRHRVLQLGRGVGGGEGIVDAAHFRGGHVRGPHYREPP